MALRVFPLLAAVAAQGGADHYGYGGITDYTGGCSLVNAIPSPWVGDQSSSHGGDKGCASSALGGFFFWCPSGCTGTLSIQLPPGYGTFTIEYGNSCTGGQVNLYLDTTWLEEIPRTCTSSYCAGNAPTDSNCIKTYTGTYTGEPTLYIVETGVSIAYVRRLIMGDGSGATGDPHLALPHGGRADFRGEHKSIYTLLSARDIAVNVMTELADFELHPSNHSHHKQVHGSFITQAHIVARTNTGRMVRTSFWASAIGDENIAWANGTVDSLDTFRIGAKMSKVFDDVKLSTGYSSMHVTTPEFEIIVTPNKFQSLSWERNVVGLHHQLDVQIKARVAEDKFKVAPHGIVGQGWDGDGKAIDGEMDAYPESGEFTTYAMAKGAIEGVPNDYKVATAYATDFKFSRFDATAATPRDVEALVAAGELNTPKSVATANADDFVGSTEYNFTEH